MSDLIDDDLPGAAGPADGSNAPEVSVSELSGAIKRMLEGAFSHVRIRGEVGRVSRPRSGHVYLDLKDDRAVISGVMWKGVAARLALQPEEGMEVIATGRLTTFPGQSKYQIVIEDIQPAGQGALMAMLEKRRAALAAEGLFDAARKRPLPYLPEVIGVVTSPSGAVIRDILHRLRDRFPRKVLIWPVAVQGERCAAEVARAIAGFNRLAPGGRIPRPDLLIVARGGGSLEDLWGFNEEIVVRAAAASAIPLISAVGHETDTTLIDHAADRRAPTPTAAAELAVPVRLELLSWTADQGARLSRAIGQAVGQRAQRLRDLSRALPRAESLLEGPRQRLDRAGDRLPAALGRAVQHQHLRLSRSTGSLRPVMLSRQITAETRHLSETSRRMRAAMDQALARQHEALARRADRLSLRGVETTLNRQRQDLDRLGQRLAAIALRQQSDRRARLDALERLRETLGYRATLARGYAVVRQSDTVITRAAAARAAGALRIEFADGEITATTGPEAGPGAGPGAGGGSGGRPGPGSGSGSGTGSPPASGGGSGTTRPAAAGSRKPPPPDQGSLF